MASSSDFIFLPSEDVMAGTKASRLKECDGSTCLAWHSINHEYGGRHLFIKQLRPELQEKEHCRLIFRKEFDIGSTLDSPYLPHYRSLKETASGMMMTMDFIEGKTLEQLLKDDPAYLRHARNLERILTQLAEALVYLHAHNVLHLDLKPSNIMLTQRTQNIVIIDLGFCSADAWLQSMGTNHNFSAPSRTPASPTTSARTPTSTPPAASSPTSPGRPAPRYPSGSGASWRNARRKSPPCATRRPPTSWKPSAPTAATKGGTAAWLPARFSPSS